mgnify:CR=1 FL=1
MLSVLTQCNMNSMHILENLKHSLFALSSDYNIKEQDDQFILPLLEVLPMQVHQ